MTITTATYARSTHRLKIVATDSDPTATLQAYVTSTGELIGTLKTSGDGIYRATFKWPTNPGSVTVKSNLGGSDTRAVKVK